MAKKIVMLDGNPKSSSYCQHLSDLYEIEANVYFDIRRFNLSNMKFNPSLDCGYDSRQELEPCLVEFQKAILWADHIVIVTPIWWGGIPAKLKGLFDRSFLPGFSYKYEGENPSPVQLLKGKTSRIIVTMDAPSDYAEEQAAPAVAQLDLFTLQFCGVKKAELNLFGPIISADAKNRLHWGKLVQGIGSKGE